MALPDMDCDNCTFAFVSHGNTGKLQLGFGNRALLRHQCPEMMDLQLPPFLLVSFASLLMIEKLGRRLIDIVRYPVLLLLLPRLFLL